ncbi:MAG: hypothetical protein JWO36_410 [Myxococcales bacterium]|nr:hypothetical protein [Myxococcales bacterium]
MVLLIVVLAACGGDRHMIAIGPAPAKMTRGTLVGPLCTGDHCKCREIAAAGDGGAGVPEDGTKRFEIRMTSANELWATVHDTVMYKSPEHAEECFYVDLGSGETAVELRASKPEGVSAKWVVHELGTKTKSWYDTFSIACGSPGVCSFEELDALKADQVHAKRDPCGSVKVKGIEWDTGKAPDQLHPSELLVRLSLDVYKFEPSKPHGEDCTKKAAKTAAPEEPAPAP